MERKGNKTHTRKNYVYITESITAEMEKMEQPQEDTGTKKRKQLNAVYMETGQYILATS